MKRKKPGPKPVLAPDVVSLRLTPDLLSRIEKLAKSWRSITPTINRSDVMRQLLAEALDAREYPYIRSAAPETKAPE